MPLTRAGPFTGAHMKIGVNTWVWTSPLTTDEFARLAAHVAGMGFDLIEVRSRAPAISITRRGAEIATRHGLGVERLRGDVAGSRSDSSRRGHSRERDGVRPALHRRGADDGRAERVGPLYSAVGRTWQATADERKRDMDLLVASAAASCRHMPPTTASCWASSRSTGSKPASSTWRRRRSRSSTGSIIRPAG